MISHTDPIATVLFDVDGTLIDSNDAHTDTWVQALREHDVTVDFPAVRALIGMGKDKLLPAIAGIDHESPRGVAIADRKKALFVDRLPALEATAGARSLVEYLQGQRIAMVIATSAGDREMNALLRRAGVDDLVPTRTSGDSVAESKPDPDIIHAAMRRAGATPATTMMIGDTPYDVEAATRAGIRAIALRCGGYWSDADLRDATDIFDDPAALLHHWKQRAG